MTLIISTISLGVVVPTLKEAHLMKTAIGQIILLVAVIADLVTMILLAVFVSLQEGGRKHMVVLILFAAGILLYFLAKRFKNRTFLESMSTGTIQIGTRGSIYFDYCACCYFGDCWGGKYSRGFSCRCTCFLLSPNR